MLQDLFLAQLMHFSTPCIFVMAATWILDTHSLKTTYHTNIKYSNFKCQGCILIWSNEIRYFMFSGLVLFCFLLQHYAKIYWLFCLKLFLIIIKKVNAMMKIHKHVSFVALYPYTCKFWVYKAFKNYYLDFWEIKLEVFHKYFN